MSWPRKQTAGVDQGIAAFKSTSRTLLTTVMKEIVADAVSDSEYNHRTPLKLSRMGIDGSTPGDIGNFIDIV